MWITHKAIEMRTIFKHSSMNSAAMVKNNRSPCAEIYFITREYWDFCKGHYQHLISMVLAENICHIYLLIYYYLAIEDKLVVWRDVKQLVVAVFPNVACFYFLLFFCVVVIFPLLPIALLKVQTHHSALRTPRGRSGLPSTFPSDGPPHEHSACQTKSTKRKKRKKWN